MNIYLDVGNSRIKWCDQYFKSVSKVDSVGALKRALCAAPDINQAQLWACNVRDDEAVAEINSLARQCTGREVHWLSAQAQFSGLINAYDQPQRLGADRWAAMVAARDRYPNRACIVVDAGTAITVDAIDAGGRHLGGVIMPGLNLLFTSLGQAARLDHISAEQRQKLLKKARPLAVSTEEAIVSGVVFSMRGGVRRVIEQQSQQINAKIQPIPILITGGDADMLNFESLSTQCLPNLVLEGVALLSRTGE